MCMLRTWPYALLRIGYSVLKCVLYILKCSGCCHRIIYQDGAVYYITQYTERERNWSDFIKQNKCNSAPNYTSNVFWTFVEYKNLDDTNLFEIIKYWFSQYFAFDEYGFIRWLNIFFAIQKNVHKKMKHGRRVR